MNAPLDKKIEQSFATAPHFPIYMDYSATTPIDPRVADKMIPYLREQFGNPASRSHAYGWSAEAAVEEVVAEALVPLDQGQQIAAGRSVGADAAVGLLGPRGEGREQQARNKHPGSQRAHVSRPVQTGRQLRRFGPGRLERS